MGRRCFTLFVLGSILAFAGCGYQLGAPTPKQLKGVKLIYIELAKNQTQHPGIEADWTNALTDALISDANYKVGSAWSADATLKTTISAIELKRLRAALEDGLRPEELEMQIAVNWIIVSAKTGQSLKSGKAVEKTRYFVDGARLTTARDNGFPDGFARVARKLVSTLSNTF